jgi:integrase
MAVLAECPFCHKKQATKNKKCKCGADLDAAKRSKKVNYWINYRLPGGKQKREFIGRSISEARDAEGKRRVQKRENRIFDIKPDSRMTFNELSAWYLELEKVKSLKSYDTVKNAIDKFNSAFGNWIVANIKLAELENHQVRRLNEGKAPATVDQEIAKTKTMIIKAFDNDMVGGSILKVFKRCKPVLKKGTDVRTRILSKSEYDAIMSELPAHLKPVFATGYYTGMRKGEIMALKWSKVDLKARMIRLEAKDTKDSEPRNIPICDQLYTILKDIPRAIHTPYVFLFRGRPFTEIKKALKRACKDAKVAYGRFVKGGFIFHDLRHTFNTNMRKSGVSDSVIMSITGHSPSGGGGCGSTAWCCTPAVSSHSLNCSHSRRRNPPVAAWGHR